MDIDTGKKNYFESPEKQTSSQTNSRQKQLQKSSRDCFNCIIFSEVKKDQNNGKNCSKKDDFSQQRVSV